MLLSKAVTLFGIKTQHCWSPSFQIYNWLAHSPSEMESYIRPGCVVLSVYASMSSTAWEQVSELA